MKKFLLGFVLLSTITLAGCSSNDTSNSSEETKNSSTAAADSDESSAFESSAEDTVAREEFKTDNGTFETALLEGWENIDPEELNDEADLAFENYDNDQYNMVLSESKIDFESFEMYNDLIYQEYIEADAQDLEKEEVSYNNLKGTRYTFMTSVDGFNIAFIHDVVAGEDYFIQNVTWTLKSSWEKNKADMISFMEGLEEISK